MNRLTFAFNITSSDGILYVSQPEILQEFIGSSSHLEVKVNGITDHATELKNQSQTVILQTRVNQGEVNKIVPCGKYNIIRMFLFIFNTL